MSESQAARSAETFGRAVAERGCCLLTGLLGSTGSFTVPIQ